MVKKGIYKSVNCFLFNVSIASHMNNTDMRYLHRHMRYNNTIMQNMAVTRFRTGDNSKEKLNEMRCKILFIVLGMRDLHIAPLAMGPTLWFPTPGTLGEQPSGVL